MDEGILPAVNENHYRENKRLDKMSGLEVETALLNHLCGDQKEPFDIARKILECRDQLFYMGFNKNLKPSEKVMIYGEYANFFLHVSKDRGVNIRLMSFSRKFTFKLLSLIKTLYMNGLQECLDNYVKDPQPKAYFSSEIPELAEFIIKDLGDTLEYQQMEKSLKRFRPYLSTARYFPLTRQFVVIFKNDSIICKAWLAWAKLKLIC